MAQRPQKPSGGDREVARDIAARKCDIGVAINPIIAGYGKLNADTIPLSKIADHKKAAANLVDKVGFDN